MAALIKTIYGPLQSEGFFLRESVRFLEVFKGKMPEGGHVLTTQILDCVALF